MKILAIILASLSLVGCDEKAVTTSLVFSLAAVESAAEEQLKAVDLLASTGDISADDAAAFRRWTEPLTVATSAAIDVISYRDTPFEARVLKAFHILVEAQRLAVFESTNNPRLRIAYVTVTGTLNTVVKTISRRVKEPKQ